MEQVLSDGGCYKIYLALASEFRSPELRRAIGELRRPHTGGNVIVTTRDHLERKMNDLFPK